MSGLKQIRRRLASVASTKQITRAMNLVSAAKLRRAERLATSGRAFVAGLEDVLKESLAALPEDKRAVFAQRGEPRKKRRIVVIAGERGLCGAFNSNVFRKAEQLAGNNEVDFVLLGKRAIGWGERAGLDVLTAEGNLPDDARYWPLEQVIESALSDFRKKIVGELIVCYTRFASAMNQEVASEVLIPLLDKESELGESRRASRSMAKFDPEPEHLLESLVPMYLSSKLIQAGLESRASEHAARMTAMDSATRNADELIDELRLFYNRARQSSITRELIDIVGGAEAVS